MKLGENSTFATYHPVNNFIFFAVVILATMFTLHPIFLVASTLFAFVYGWMLHGWQDVKHNLILTLLLTVIVSLGNTILSHNGVTVFFYMNDNAITLEAICYGVAMGLMIATVIHWFAIAQVVCTQDKFLYLFGAWAPSIALTVSMMFRYIPLLRRRFEVIHEAQYAMGRGDRKSRIANFTQAAREASVLISWSLENSIDTADSMEARGYGLKGRTSFHLFHFVGRDLWNLIYLGITGGCLLAGIFTSGATTYYYPKMIWNVANVETILTLLAYLLVLVMPIWIDMRGEMKWKRLQ